MMDKHTSKPRNRNRKIGPLPQRRHLMLELVSAEEKQANLENGNYESIRLLMPHRSPQRQGYVSLIETFMDVNAR